MPLGNGDTPRGSLFTGALEPPEATWMAASLMLLAAIESMLSLLRADSGRLGQ